MEYRAGIKPSLLGGLSSPEIHQRLVKVYKEPAPSFLIVYKWVADLGVSFTFKRGRQSLEDKSPPKNYNMYGIDEAERIS